MKPEPHEQYTRHGLFNLVPGDSVRLVAEHEDGTLLSSGPYWLKKHIRRVQESGAEVRVLTFIPKMKRGGSWELLITPPDRARDDEMASFMGVGMPRTKVFVLNSIDKWEETGPACFGVRYTLAQQIQVLRLFRDRCDEQYGSVKGRYRDLLEDQSMWHTHHIAALEGLHKATVEPEKL